MKQYLNMVDDVINHGVWKDNRTGIPTKTVFSGRLRHDMSEGFPLLTTKDMSKSFKLITTELEFFLKGLTDKRWLQERGCKIWDAWCNPEKIWQQEGRTPEQHKKAQREESDLGPIYGYQWRQFGVSYKTGATYQLKKHDQLRNIVDLLKTDPNSRYMVCSAWNPTQIHQMALPACHLIWGIVHLKGKLNLWWDQRSCDLFLGVPFNIASYAILLELFCHYYDFVPGILEGNFRDLHIYKNHIPQMAEQLEREPKILPSLSTYTGGVGEIWDFDATSCALVDYNSHGKLTGKVAI